jgi:UDP-glucose 4-epimerase
VTILLTGATGLVGRAFLAVAGQGSEVVAVTQDPTRATDSAAAGLTRWVSLDLRDPGFARRLPGRVDAIVHLAQSPEYRSFPAGAVDVVDVNMGATTRLLDYAQRAGADRFVFASTGTIYEPSLEPLSEESPIRCASFYAASKRGAELLIEQYRDLIACWLMRIFTVYGEGQQRQLIANLARMVETGEPVTVEGPSGLPLSPIHAVDVARVLWEAAAPGAATSGSGCEVVNVGGREALGIRELAEQIGRVIGRAPRFVFSGDDDPPGWIADRRKLERTFRLDRPLSFADGIRRTLEADSAVSGRLE